jgi:hypothetical protein
VNQREEQGMFPHLGSDRLECCKVLFLQFSFHKFPPNHTPKVYRFRDITLLNLYGARLLQVGKGHKLLGQRETRKQNVFSFWFVFNNSI